MAHNPQVILDRFHQYAETFESLKPCKVLPFFHYPAILIAPGKTAAIKNRIEGFFTFNKVMSDLKRRGYHYAHTKSLSVRQLSNDLAIVSGIVIRCKEDNSELERFGLTYTLRQVNGSWNIIVGALHDVSA
jgi:hypothetical protein